MLINPAILALLVELATTHLKLEITSLNLFFFF